MKKSFIATILFLSAAMGAISARAAAPVLKIEPLTSTTAVGVPFSIRIYVDSDIPLNVYRFEFVYPDHDLKIVNINTANSIINVWQNQPVVLAGGAVKIEGGSLRPFRGSRGELLIINFEPLRAGDEELGFRSAQVYLADGKGTAVVPSVERLSFATQERASGVAEVASSTDTEAPQISSFSFVADPYDQNNKIVSFNVADKGAGVGEIEMRTRSGIFWSPWQRVVNPVGLPKNVWAVELKVTDNAGNVTIDSLYDPGTAGALALHGLLVIASLLLLIGIFARGRFF